MQRVVVTGLGCVTPLGVGVKTSWNRLIQGKCAVVSTKDLAEGAYKNVPCQVAAMVPTGDECPDQWNAKRYAKQMDLGKTARFSQYAIIAAREALDDAGFVGKFEDDVAERVGYKSISPLFVPRLLINMAAGHVSMQYNIKGPNHAASTACTTGLHSIGDAAHFIQRGTADIMLAGGAESCIHPLAIAGFAKARALSTEFNDSPEKASRPFDSQRSGFVMGEGAGVLVLEGAEHAKKRGAKVYAEIKGYGLSADAWHITAPPRDGDGAFRAMKAALEDARVTPESVDYVNAHATGTKLGDAAENAAIRKLIVGKGPNGGKKASSVNVSSIKGAIGHLLGAAGAVESIMTILAIQEVSYVLPSRCNLLRLDSDESLRE
ncbi:hypothetical protein ABW20_dc0105906 [Dactylellina cionopaga]|nr:hypothetical protein ABW20_dc0105906 [Dactylellina cionopaga]